jgi:NADPH-dependent curcumin reductase
MAVNRRILLKSRPAAMPEPENFELSEAPIPEPRDGEVLVRTLFLSLDPYMRGRMSDARSYATPVPIGGVMGGQTVNRVEASKDPNFAKGDIVTCYAGWQDYAALPGKHMRKLDPNAAPISTALGVLGMPGRTAYVGLLDIGKPKAGETVVVSAASGAVGSVVGQIAKLKGCRAVGIAGGPDKCRYVVDELGFDACVDHRGPDLRAALKEACPKGVDVYYENVGGKVQQAVWPLLNDFARVPVCGLIAHYSSTEPPAGPDMRVVLTRRVLVKGFIMKGFIISDHPERELDVLREMSAWVREGKLKYREDIAEGLERAPQAFIGLLQGKNFGKQLVRVAS